MYSDLISKYIPAADVYLFNTGSARKAWLLFGCNYISEIGRHRFVLWAPNARSVSLVGDFNGWDEKATPLQRHGNIWCAFVPGLSDGDLYKYCVIGKNGKKVLKSDPFAAWSQTDTETASRVWTGSYIQRHTEAYDRSLQRFPDPKSAPMNIYEVHLGSWKTDGAGRVNYVTAGRELAEYCRAMHYTHVEFLPLTEYPYPPSWGYQVTGYYAPTSRYGSPDEFAEMVDIMHENGIGVIMDWVPAHFPRDAHGLAEFDGTRLYECKEERMASHPEWGTLIFDYALPEVQSFLISSACSFIERYHIDGIRVDAVSSMLYLNYCRRDGEYTPNIYGHNINLGAVEFLRKLNTAVHSTGRRVITVAEESSAYPMITGAVEDGGLGFDFKWDMGYMHDTLDYFMTDPLFRRGCHDKISFSMMYAFSERFVLAYSHDEVVHGKKSMLDKMFGSYEQKFASLRVLYGLQLAHPGKKLGFMGSEFAQFIEWDYRKGLDWLLLLYPMHRAMQEYCRELNRLYLENPPLYQNDVDWEGFRWLNVNERDRSSVAFMRRDFSGNVLVFACNFLPVEFKDFTVGMPCEGELTELLSSDDARFGGSGSVGGSVSAVGVPFLEHPCSAKLCLPPLTCKLYKLIEKRSCDESND
ncbi:MAG: 1,4-alpha-glucan branching protein GlgB [Oscillospiraceae bacterium]|nr:1,4-alpha-glucan branching protein GlgB [Oscillospiraceae bacterium]